MEQKLKEKEAKKKAKQQESDKKTEDEKKTDKETEETEDKEEEECEEFLNEKQSQINLILPPHARIPIPPKKEDLAELKNFEVSIHF